MWLRLVLLALASSAAATSNLREQAKTTTGELPTSNQRERRGAQQGDDGHEEAPLSPGSGLLLMVGMQQGLVVGVVCRGSSLATCV